MQGTTEGRARPWALQGLIAAVVTTATGCGGAMTLVVKPPVEEACKSNGLKGCGEITEGVMAYLDGKEADGVEKIKRGAAKNAPEDVRKYAAAVKAITDLPGVGDYAGPIKEVAELLASEAGPEGAKSAKATKGGPDAGAAVERMQASAIIGPSLAATMAPAHAEPPRDDVALLRTATVLPAEDGTTCPAGVLAGSSASCRAARAFMGPIVVTDLVSSGDCPDELFVAVGDLQRPEWFVLNRAGQAMNVRGAPFVVQPESVLWIGVRGARAPTVEARCAITWAGRKTTRDVGATQGPFHPFAP